MISTTPQDQSSLSPVDLRHMTSNIVLNSPKNRTSQLLRTSDPRLGSRSPNSIPSSPTSVHSSSSAIFERDIEPIAPPSPPFLPHHPPNPHRIPRAKATEQLEHSVPSVLDSAAAILTSLDDSDLTDQVAIVAPASTTLDPMARSSGFASPIGSFRSRSPSPQGARTGQTMAAAHRNDLLLNIPHTLSAHTVSTAPSSSPAQSIPRPIIQTNMDPSPASAPTPSIVTPTSAYFSTTSSATGDESPTTTTREQPPQPLPSPPQPVSSSSSPPLSTTASHPPSPTHVATKRLSFMSYSDLLSSTPASTLTLSSLTTSASSTDPPPHIPSVSGLTAVHAQQAGSAATSLRGFVVGPPKRDSIALLDDVGGEWEREGLGRGLEERLETLMPK